MGLTGAKLEDIVRTTTVVVYYQARLFLGVRWRHN